MTIVRREHRAHFTILPNAIFLDERLSIEAKGVLGYLLSRPHKWSVRLEQVGWTLKIGRKKLQRIFRELISTGYITREQQRMADDQRFGRVDYVVRDVPEAVTRSVDKCTEAQITAGANKSKLWPRVQKGPAYKELKNKKLKQLQATTQRDGSLGFAMTGHRPARSEDQEARYDTEIVAMVGNAAEGWELLCALPTDVLADVRARYRRGELDELAITELRYRYRHLLVGRCDLKAQKTR
ncbi:MAG: hypothetical protein GEU95_12025 [Rhizobiales bacterium]|nr:hypothetical protein [Hyphomicrobiales bacterium]